jgi:hypothetical protein
VRIAFGDTTARVAGRLSRTAVRPGDRVILPGSQAGFAESVGAYRVAVNRALGALATHRWSRSPPRSLRGRFVPHRPLRSLVGSLLVGLLRTEPGAVVVSAPEALAAIAAE